MSELCFKSKKDPLKCFLWASNNTYKDDCVKACSRESGELPSFDSFDELDDEDFEANHIFSSRLSGIRGHRGSLYKNKTKAPTFTNDPIFTNVKFDFTLKKWIDPTTGSPIRRDRIYSSSLNFKLNVILSLNADREVVFSFSNGKDLRRSAFCSNGNSTRFIRNKLLEEAKDLCDDGKLKTWLNENEREFLWTNSPSFVLNSVRIGTSSIWTGSKRYNETHLIDENKVLFTIPKLEKGMSGTNQFPSQAQFNNRNRSQNCSF